MSDINKYALIRELVEIGRMVQDRSYSASGYISRGSDGPIKNERAREIGRAFLEAGGEKMMIEAREAVKAELGNVAVRELDLAWNGIGGVWF